MAGPDMPKCPGCGKDIDSVVIKLTVESSLDFESGAWSRAENSVEEILVYCSVCGNFITKEQAERMGVPEELIIGIPRI